ncbi:MAG: biotin--[acetyl-CoA-carboxylase] ligase [Actinobacteria bacterium]|nr:MAG: biotin--[acetyl-CoA-carboxylase] ligase [Actinomycetota bacterium]
MVLARAGDQSRRCVDRARDRRRRRGPDLADPVIGTPRVHHRAVDSTNERARELAVRGAPHGTLVTAAEQTAGRGRQGRSWLAPAGDAVLMSVVLRDLDERFPLLPLAAAVAVAEACESLAPVRCEIKWPNDVWIERRKVAGILVEGRPAAGWAVLGVGVNVRSAPAELGDIATSIGAGVAVESALGALVDALARWLGREGAQVLEAWRARDALRGESVRWADGAGTAAGIDDSGSLLVQSDTGLIALSAGEVHLQR